jgi:CAAX protease family protein
MDAALMKCAVLWAISFALVGFVEEFLFRGCVQFTLASAIGFWSAAFVWSLVFGVIHLTNRGETLVGICEAVLFALLACLSLRRTGAIAWHAAGDYAETFLFPCEIADLRLQVPC